jgi:AraC-like DNA-binding protein
VSLHIAHKAAHFLHKAQFITMSSATCPSSSKAEKLENARTRSKSIVDKLSSSQLYKDYKKAFREATGLPLAIRPAKAYANALRKTKEENPFCALIAETNESCASCLKMQQDLEQKAGLEPKSLHCFAGLCDSAVPIRVGDELIAFLQTGQILLHQPNEEEFTRTTKQLLSWGADVNLKALEEAYFQTKVFDTVQYNAMLRLLSTFAEHLATISNSIEPAVDDPEPALVGNAKRYIQDRFQGKISLDEAAKAVNASTRHFCKVFKQATGLTFTDYLARIRVEKAKNLLQNPHLRVSEIAFETGFDSISQFNRSFKRISGVPPTQFRSELIS